MTGIVTFLMDFIVQLFNLALSFKFELFGFQVSLMSLQLGAIVLCLFVSFSRNETPSFMRYASGKFSRSENKKDKQNESRSKHGKD